ncbi:MAG TPA: aldehyde dehydrogenase family protein, partial [Amycolatopsis sp.]|nr:aldehyde dehydrogenase family protein [Amycolatopsis sp.]
MTVPFWIAGKPVTSAETVVVRHPFDGGEAGAHYVPSTSDIEAAVQAAHDAADELATLPAHVRAGALDHVSHRLGQRSEEIAQLITAESGKPLKWARGEVGRAVSTFRWAAEEARRFSGELQRLDTDAGGTGRLALVRRVPKGPVLGITPFNF